ncbi:hypothetical protein CC2G_013612 [Coprinopsis cinerea AmutBmut pab1-1]|nr:hypothetical protein CC2G_013612 [Coprinopsis cinerea AmutBmut pab1-1]
MKLKRFAVLGGITATAVAATPKVKIGRTTVVGRENAAAGVDFFGGKRSRNLDLQTRFFADKWNRPSIPFAEPPVGSLRFRSPILKTRCTETTLEASSYGKACLQPPLVIPLADTSEDCLSINVVRPTGTRIGDKLPVGTPVIYVNFNYRLGPFGFPQGQEAHDRRELNLGLKYVTAALEWVHANINFFGGDKNKITIFGESAGAITIGILYLNRQFEKL